MTRAPAAVLAAALLVALVACTPAAPTPPPQSESAGPEVLVAPVVDDADRILVIGDSITLGVNACAEEGPCESVSWATGDDPIVASVRDRARAQNPAAEVGALARSGAQMATAAAAVEHVTAEEPQLAILLLGANDACARSLEEMTTPEDFQSALTAVLTALAASPQAPAILVMSVPDLEGVWQTLHDDPAAVASWNANPACRSLFAGADSLSTEAEAARRAVAERVDAYNVVITETCAVTERCSTDGGALHAHIFTADEMSPIDHFHPSIDGQEAIAGIVWQSLAEMPGDAAG